MDIETAYYIVHYFPRLKTRAEAAALDHHHALFKIGSADRYDSPEAYQHRIDFYKDFISTDPQVLSLLREGIEAFYIKAAARIMSERPDDVFMNTCSQCGRLARTPYAKQCKHCGHGWHDTIAAGLLIKNMFTVAGDKHLFILGDVRSGAVDKGMRIDLTFFGVGKKPIIESLKFSDPVAGMKTGIVLGIMVGSEERDYLKKRRSLAVPVTIEK